ncbi:MAG: DEAD/DEAH box helicase family protein [Paludibacteraceae bacterium]|nr:DEAD/DEAH box helicase family protein [Paludibacteraceae bacterium]
MRLFQAIRPLCSAGFGSDLSPERTNEQNTMNIHDILAKVRQQSVTERQKGAVFEKLMQRWLQSDPRYCNLLEKVWLWDEFPAKGEFGGKDTGIDLVARTEEGDYWAIQCKCYDANAVIDKPAVDTFLSTSSKTFTDDVTLKTVGFSLRLWISTTDHWGPTATQTITNQNPPVQRIGLKDLEMSPVDWAKLEGGSQGNDVRLAGKQLKEHQLKAISKARTHFIEEGNDRGKLVMACGTGKTYTALNLVEQLTDSKGLVLFMVPSIALLGQALNDWSADSKKPFKAVCICSDSKSNKNFDDKEDSVIDLPRPATTNADTIAKQLMLYREHSEQGKGMVVVFSTYQSVDAVSEAQRAILKETNGEYGVFDFIVCDEAHRTTGVMRDRDNESSFTKIHSNENVQGRKRLYMTATPRLYGEGAQKKAAEKDAVLFSMDDENIYGKEFFRVNFSYAVENRLLTDYKVLVLTVNGSDLPTNIKEKVENPLSKEFDFDDTTKLIGVINGLAKQVKGDGGKTWEVDPRKMHRALAFCSSIGDDYKPGTSKNVAHVLPQLSQDYYNSLNDAEKDKAVLIEAKHIDGSMDSLQRNERLQWLREEPENENICKVITNVRCLSEGVDVPALDAVLFLSARNSQVDVVQSVGRIMRNFKKGTPEEKKYGYIIIPIVVDENQKPEEVLDKGTTFDVVWSILNALRSHDDNFNAEVNKINLNRKKNDPTSDPSGKITIGAAGLGVDDPQAHDDAVVLGSDEVGRQLALRFGELKDGIYAKLVEKCGDRLYWENWAKEVGEVAKNFIARITQMVLKEGIHKEEFDHFLEGLKKNINDSIDGPQAVEMLAQHLITRPVFDALFAEYEFVKNNAVSRSMQHMIELLEDKGLTKDLDVLEKFYDSVKRNVTNIDNLEGKQSIIKSLYEKFFKGAFPLTVEKLGIVYTPVECVDFIIRSVNDILKQEFDTSLTEENVHILDPFTGTGTFITRLLQSGLIKKEDMERKYRNEIHCNEIVLLAYYIADVNIESVFHDIVKREQYLPYDGICLTDTFQLNESGDNDIFSQLFPENSERLKKQKKAPVRVVIGNPPYSVGQKSANDNAQNLSYKNLDSRVANTYVKLSKSNNKNSLYDSYIKAFRWASDRINANGNTEGGIVAFISNGQWLDSNAGDGMRKCLENEFSSIYVLNLRGNQRTSGELSRKEGGKIFGSGSRTPIAITFLVKNPKAENKKAVIHYHDIGDYLSREDKLKKVKDFRSVGSGKIDWQIITPNDKQDWINQRDGLFDTLMLIGDKDDKKNDKVFFYANAYGRGLGTSRDTWVYNYSKDELLKNMKMSTDFYNSERKRYQETLIYGKVSVKDFLNYDSTKISWSLAYQNDIEKNREHIFDGNFLLNGLIRPYVKQNLYYDKFVLNESGAVSKIIPSKNQSNLCICMSGEKGYSCLISNLVPDLHIIGAAQCFPLYWYEERGEKKVGNQLELFGQEEGESKYIRHDGVSDWILKEVRSRYGNLTSISKEDIFYYVYGLLHSEEYRTRFADDLRKSLPRIPIVDKVADFVAFNKAGRALAELHLNYESVAACPEVKVTELGKKEDYIDEETGETVLNGDAFNYYSVEKMRFPSGQKAKDKPSTIIYNPHITLEHIPAVAYDYVVNGKSAIEWIMERYAVTIDKDSLIKNDPNDWSREHNQPRYILDLLLSVINVSVQTVAIVKGLPALNLGADAATTATAATTTPPTPEIKPMTELLEEVAKEERFVRYLPVYGLKAACGAFESNELPGVTGWVDIAESGIHPKGDLNYFVCQAKGHSMEPRIQDGDYVVCRFYTPQSAGSRNGKMVLASISEYDGDYDGRYTIKEYRSEKNADGSGKSVTLYPLNKDYSPIELSEDDDVRIVAEVVGVVK